MGIKHENIEGFITSVGTDILMMITELYVANSNSNYHEKIISYSNAFGKKQEYLLPIPGGFEYLHDVGSKHQTPQNLLETKKPNIFDKVAGFIASFGFFSGLTIILLGVFFFILGFHK